MYNILMYFVNHLSTGTPVLILASFSLFQFSYHFLHIFWKEFFSQEFKCNKSSFRINKFYAPRCSWLRRKNVHRKLFPKSIFFVCLFRKISWKNLYTLFTHENLRIWNSCRLHSFRIFSYPAIYMLFFRIKKSRILIKSLQVRWISTEFSVWKISFELCVLCVNHNRKHKWIVNTKNNRTIPGIIVTISISTCISHYGLLYFPFNHNQVRKYYTRATNCVHVSIRKPISISIWISKVFPIRCKKKNKNCCSHCSCYNLCCSVALLDYWNWTTSLGGGYTVAGAAAVNQNRKRDSKFWKMLVMYTVFKWTHWMHHLTLYQLHLRFIPSE